VVPAKKAGPVRRVGVRAHGRRGAGVLFGQVALRAQGIDGSREHGVGDLGGRRVDSGVLGIAGVRVRGDAEAQGLVHADGCHLSHERWRKRLPVPEADQEQPLRRDRALRRGNEEGLERVAGELAALPEIRDQPVQRLIEVHHSIGRSGQRRGRLEDVSFDVLEEASDLQRRLLGRRSLDLDDDRQSVHLTGLCFRSHRGGAAAKTVGGTVTRASWSAHRRQRLKVKVELIDRIL
jgi:hypothetical protein